MNRQRDGIAAVIQDVEKLAKQLRADIRKRAVGLPKNLPAVAGKLRKRAAAAAEQVEKYVHRLRMDLERGAAKGAKAKRKRVNSKAKTAGISA